MTRSLYIRDLPYLWTVGIFYRNNNNNDLPSMIIITIV